MASEPDPKRDETLIAFCRMVIDRANRVMAETIQLHPDPKGGIDAAFTWVEADSGEDDEPFDHTELIEQAFEAQRILAELGVGTGDAEWSKVMSKKRLAELLGLGSVDQLNRLHGDKLKSDARKSWRIRLDLLGSADRAALENAPPPPPRRQRARSTSRSKTTKRLPD